MSRPAKCRMIDTLPEVTYFKPRGVPLRYLNEIYLTLEGFEALRLADFEGLSHEQSAQSMGVSRQTFGRTLSQARNTVAKALVTGLALRIHGGNYAVAGTAGNNALNNDEQKLAMNEACGQHDASFSRKTKEAIMDKIAISSEGPTLEDLLDPRFGRAAGFIVVDTKTMKFDYVDNGASQAMAQGAGIQAAETVAATGAKAVLTGFVGPKAFMALEAAGIRVGQNLENMTVQQALNRYLEGHVEWASSPNRGGHGR
jgi:predicted DNA-binding protein (UPF0251 family)/predicted Fe-Mo cluster-binding NifX family protein